MITELVTRDTMEDAKMLITNAIYFCGKFMNPFDKKKTKKNVPFWTDRKRDTERSKVNMMANLATQTTSSKGE